MPVSPPPATDCHGLRAQVQALEAGAATPDARARLAALEAHLAGCAGCRQRFALRLRRLEALCALRSRDLPAGALDGLSERVLAELRRPGAAPRGGSMSDAFLDAPESLSRWRVAALAASLLLAVGTALLGAGRLRWSPSSAAEPPGAGEQAIDLRDLLLQRFDAPAGDPGPADRVERGRWRVEPVLLPGAGRFFQLQAPAGGAATPSSSPTSD